MRTKMAPAPILRSSGKGSRTREPRKSKKAWSWWDMPAAVLFAATETGFISGELRLAAEKLQQLLDELQQQGAVISGDLRDALEVALGKLPLVSQREFDVQTAKLARAEEKLAQLERQIKELEDQVSGD
ncbi:accessory factor UbiK family protein [Microbulbifer bruguierae]|uniref:Accessory factor UbiK family protein n=1 Tax=Microbulbifer bruguierae TaxID=3029061 RepID=A0ABY8N9J2_9GAMM|nr:accessory factor UbiK family protein [Microbulbifer bruguierae]WGL15155.1 accessory factor UbiK family protein [Microbulbifer bruguierae]